MLSNVLFDLDGTLTDPKEGITRSIRFALEQLGVAAPDAEELTWCIGPPLRGSLARLLNTADEGLLDRALSHYRKRFSETGMFENAVYPQILPCLRRSRDAGLRLILATAKPRVFALPILDHFGLTPFFHAVHGSELDGRLTDKGALIAHILRCERLDPMATLIVGDRSHDILGGKKNGIATAAVTYGYGSREEIGASGPDFIFDTPAELAEFLVRAANG
jgi:phosphoglycolate phosphatase